MTELLNDVLRHASVVEWAVLLCGLALFVGGERLLPRPGRAAMLTAAGATAQRRRRWATNIGLYLLILAALAFAFQPVQNAAIAWGGAAGWGGIAALGWPEWAKIVLGFVVIDLLQYTLHAVSHRVPWLWRLHQVHHADTGFDATTAIRHHPLEAMLSGGIALLVSAAIGMPLLSIVLYGVVQLAHTLFCHADIALPPRLDRALRWVVVTPDMHRVHHSSHPGEGDRNFGMVLSWWDPLFRTLCAQPALGHDAMRFGLYDPAQQARAHGLLDSLVLPFRRVPGAVAALSSPASAAGSGAIGQGMRRRRRRTPSKT